MLKAWLYFCPLFHCKCNFVKGVSLWKYVHTPWQPDVLGCRPSGFWGITPCWWVLKSGKCTAPVASGWAYLMEGIWFWLERYLNLYSLREVIRYLQTCSMLKKKKKKKMLDVILMYLYKVPPFYFILCTIYRFKQNSSVSHDMLKCHWRHDTNMTCPDSW